MFNATRVDEFLAGAKRFKGQWYKWGGGHGGEMKKPGGVDCSGLVQQAGFKADINMIGTAAMQQDKGRAVSMRNLKPGDLVFRGNPAYHVGIYLGNGKVLHAPRTGKRVGIVDVGYFQSARRIFKGYTDATREQVKKLGAAFKQADADRNGRLNPEELRQDAAKGLRRYDRDKNQHLAWNQVKDQALEGKQY